MTSSEFPKPSSGPYYFSFCLETLSKNLESKYVIYENGKGNIESLPWSVKLVGLVQVPKLGIWIAYKRKLFWMSTMSRAYIHKNNAAII